MCLLSLFVLSITHNLHNVSYAYCPPYFAFVEKSESNFPACLRVSGGMFCGGDLEVINECSEDVTLNGKVIKTNETEYGFNDVAWEYNSPEQDIQYWTLIGTYKGEEISVSGYTQNWENKSTIERLFNQIPGYIVNAASIAIVGVLIIFSVSLFINKNKRVKKING